MKKMWTMMISFSSVFLTSSLALAGEGASDGSWGMPMAIGFGMGIAALGGALGQSRAVATALEGICRNPNASDKVFVPMILGLAFIESLVLFTWVLMFLLLGKI